VTTPARVGDLKHYVALCRIDAAIGSSDHVVGATAGDQTGGEHGCGGGQVHHPDPERIWIHKRVEKEKIRIAVELLPLGNHSVTSGGEIRQDAYGRSRRSIGAADFRNIDDPRDYCS